jgi:PIN domain nuclease of toxin-antitoxin system
VSDIAVDTHSLLWYLQTAPKLSPTADQAIRTTLAAGHRVFVSSVSLAEILYLTEKQRIPGHLLGAVLAELRHPDSGFVEVPFAAEVVEAMALIPRAVVPDMPDRMIAGTALHLGCSLVTADHEIRASNVPTIW